MEKLEPTPCAQSVAVELLILRILRRGFAGTLVTGAMSALGCDSETEEPPRETKQERSPVEPTDASASSREPEKPLSARMPAIDAAALPSSDDAGTSNASSGSDGGSGRGASCSADTPHELRASGLSTVAEFDYVAIRKVNGYYQENAEDAGSASTWTHEDFTTLSESGTSCASATDDACAQKVAKHPSQFVSTYCVQTCLEYAVVTTRGNDVKRWVTDAELLTLLGKVDSPDEAILFATRAGYSAPCVTADARGLEVTATRYKDICPIVYERVTLRVSETGKLEPINAVELTGGPFAGACVGRVPAGLCSASEARHESAVGDYLAHCAHLEDASVYAFERLARELRAYGAPPALIAAALHAADDEVRHARVVAQLARARAGNPVAAEVHELSLRTLEEIATENATEGCVRETYGALVGGYQARHARDIGIRSAMREVAADEARHASLSYRVHVWALSRLDAQARKRVLTAQRRAIAELARECAAEVDGRLSETLGLPSASVAEALLRELALSLWTGAASGEAQGAAAAMG